MGHADSFKVLDRTSGESFQCSPQQSLLIAMERRNQGLITVGCRGGGCGLCKIKIVAGEYVTKAMSRKQISREEEEQGYVLACRSYPCSDLIFEVVTGEQAV